MSWETYTQVLSIMLWFYMLTAGLVREIKK
ncbi:hypothetical protein PBI_LAMBO_76 [Gordonia phage Lambo]|uniref:Uncharacterized protein n=7 Tax=Lambovirus TaxID=2843412 RepID=A0A5J6TPI0_9CAUD|nr:membrane protein [Gordonia phage Gibbin]YP_009852629.1 membrane protein [Gordonia phage Lambo]YP_009852729.1 membrane protein [Gordonia phage Sadboi]YP_009854033.1 hypothetical protein HWC82_gp79 [Gordonia phage Yikes]QFG08214.1 hypothetical protein PBI_GRETELLYN_78 [Gordonia phage GretelLyn]UVT31057.1 hypothetical protein SEA_PARVUSTARDA_76 [Gordonia phage ParvusTarda]WNM66016.1 membrane protein [Gordonia phage BirthdayBoy]WNM69446.1 membrane protein [Gordonia phage Sampudon]QFG10642.1 